MISILIIAVLGGMKHPIGAFIGAIVYVLLQNFAIDLFVRERFNLVIGGVFLAIVLFSPDGLLGLWAKLRSSLVPDRRPSQPKRRPTVKATKRLWIRTAVGARRGRGLMGSAWAQETLKIGLLANLEGPFAVPGPGRLPRRRHGAEGKERHGRRQEDRVRQGLVRRDARQGGRATRKAVEQDKVQIMIGPLSGDEGIAVKNYAKTKPDITFINGSSGAQATTLTDPAPNFYRFNTEGAQWMVGLGEHALAKGYKKIFLISEDYGFPYSQVQGFMASYCAKGGKVVDKAWVPLGTKDYASVIAKIPKDIDALFVVLGGSDAVNFLTQYEQAGGNKPMIGGSITVDQTVLNYKGKRRESLLGTASAGPMADSIDTPEWKKFVADYKAHVQGRLPEPVAVRLPVLHQHQGDARGARRGQGRPLGRPEGVPRGAAEDQLQGPGRRGEDRRQPQRRRHDLHHRSRRRRRTARSTTRSSRRCRTSRRRSACPKAEFKKMGLGSRDVPDCRK